MTLAPKHSGQVSFEAPVEQGPSPLLAVAELVSGFAANHYGNKPKPSASDQKGEALRPFYERLNDLKNSDMEDQAFTTEGRKIAREYLARYPQYRTDILEGASGAFGFEVAEPMEAIASDVITEGMNEWLATPEGQAALMSGVVPNKSGTGADHTATMENVGVAYAQARAEEAQIAKISRKLEIVEGDENLQIAESRNAWQQIAPTWTQQNIDLVNGLVTAVSIGDENFDSPEEQMAFLRGMRRDRAQLFREKSLAAGIHTSVIDEQLDSLLAPFDDMLTMMENMAGDTSTMLAAYRNIRQLELDQELHEHFGLLAANPDFMREYFGFMAGEGIYDRKTAAALLESMKDGMSSANRTNFSFFPDISPVTRSAAVQPGATTRPEQVTEYKRKSDESPTFLTDQVAQAKIAIEQANANDPRGVERILHGLGQFATVSEAWEGPMSNQVFRDFFTPSNMARIRTAIDQGGQFGINTQDTLANIISTQIKFQNSTIRGMSNALNLRVETRNGQVVVLDLDNKVVPRPVNQLFGNQRVLFDAVDNINLLNNIGRTIGGDTGKISQGVTSMMVGTEKEEVDYEALELYLNDEISLDEINNVTHMSSANAPGGIETHPLIDVMDKHEGGGNYDTLFGHSQRPGGQFAGVKVSEMTIGQLLQFSDPSGAYGQWVAATRPDKEMGPATPMGRFQFVGSTLRSTANSMGLPMNTIFNEEVQEAMFDFKVRERLAKADTMEGKIKQLRLEWQGFKNVDDQTLANAISQIEGTQPVTLVNVPTGAGVVSAEATSPAPRGEGSPTSGGPTSSRSGGRGGGVSIGRVDAGNTRIPQAGAGNTGDMQAEVSRSARAVQGELNERAIARLREAGVGDIDGIPRFSNVAELEVAMSQGAIKANDIVIVNGQPMRAM